MSKRIVVTGVTGQVGGAFCQLSIPGAMVIPANRSTLALDNISTIEPVLEALAPDIFINCAAYTAVDRAEEEPQLAHTINADAPAEIAKYCASHDVPLVQISTDYVFNGEKRHAYSPDDEIAPLGAYGKSKAAGELALRLHCPKHIILRTAWVYSAGGENFLNTMLRLGGEREELRIVADQYGCPTTARDIAVALHRIITALINGAEPWGTYHFCNSEKTTWYGFASEIFRQVSGRGKTVPSIVPVSTEEYPTPACRPASSVLDCTSFTETFGYEPRNWQTALRDELAELL